MLVARFIDDRLHPRPRPPPVVVTNPAGGRTIVHAPPRRNGRRSEMFDYEEYLQRREMFDYEEYLQRRMDMAGYYDELD